MVCSSRRLAGDAVAVAVMLAMVVVVVVVVVVAVNCVRRINTSPSATASAGICWQFSGSARAVTLPSGSGQKGVLFFRRFFFLLFLFPFVFAKVVSGYRGAGYHVRYGSCACGWGGVWCVCACACVWCV